ncbi:MAG: hypothetical protein IT416_05185, partial [Candidatus Pacebacteria bacterium]|nr:hypothetical protein [Candidatus Paceibacterota bacterium]
STHHDGDSKYDYYCLECITHCEDSPNGLTQSVLTQTTHLSGISVRLFKGEKIRELFN